jgi:hypothetical protein
VDIRYWIDQKVLSSRFSKIFNTPKHSLPVGDTPDPQDGWINGLLGEVQGGYIIKFSKIYIMNELEGGGYMNPHDGWMNDYKGGRSEDEW